MEDKARRNLAARVLDVAAHVLARHEFTTGAYARDAAGKVTAAVSPNACAFCTAGVVLRTLGRDGFPLGPIPEEVENEVWPALAQACATLAGEDLPRAVEEDESDGGLGTVLRLSDEHFDKTKAVAALTLARDRLEKEAA